MVAESVISWTGNGGRDKEMKESMACESVWALWSNARGEFWWLDRTQMRAAVYEFAYAIRAREAGDRPPAAFSRLRALTWVVADGSTGSQRRRQRACSTALEFAAAMGLILPFRADTYAGQTPCSVVELS